nr:hypothetical protein [Mucilaginibacter sp. X4EP1]
MQVISMALFALYLWKFPFKPDVGNGCHPEVLEG